MMKHNPSLAVWLWSLQVLTGLALILFLLIHTIDNATILIGPELYEKALALWHEGLPHWLYKLMVVGLVGVFLIHALNGIRIASKPYKNIDIAWKHNLMLRHPGTSFWFTQVLTGSAIAMFGIWHLIVQHGNIATSTADQSHARMSMTVFLIYCLFLATIMFHAFNGIRSVLIKLGVMTDKAKEAVLISIMALLFVVFFVTGVASMAKFLPPPGSNPLPATNPDAAHSQVSIESSGIPGAAEEFPVPAPGDSDEEPSGE